MASINEALVLCVLPAQTDGLKGTLLKPSFNRSAQQQPSFTMKQQDCAKTPCRRANNKLNV